jgi:hypothetical protein
MAGGDKKIKKGAGKSHKKIEVNKKVSLAVKISHLPKRIVDEEKKKNSDPVQSLKKQGQSLKSSENKDQLKKRKSFFGLVGKAQPKTEQISDEEMLARLAYKNEILQDRLERQKQLIMWGGITFFMILIICLWVYNIKQVINITPKSSASNIDINSMSDDISSRMRQLKDNLAEIKKFSAIASSTEAASSSPASGSIASNSAELKKSSGQLPVSQMSASSTEASSTASAPIIASSTKATDTGLIDEKELQQLQKRLDELEKQIKK